MALLVIAAGLAAAGDYVTGGENTMALAAALLGLALVLLAGGLRRAAPAPVRFIDERFERNAFVIVATEPDRKRAVRDAAGSDDPYIRPDTRPYIRIDDTTEMWTPARVREMRNPDAPAGSRRRGDPPLADYRFQRLDRDGAVKLARHRPFPDFAAAQDFAEKFGGGDAVEIWQRDRKLATVPATAAA